jgi:hypothetical protein
MVVPPIIVVCRERFVQDTSPPQMHDHEAGIHATLQRKMQAVKTVKGRKSRGLDTKQQA